MTSLSSNLVNWSSIAYYKYGDTVRHDGGVWILHQTADKYVVGIPPVWYNPSSPPSPLIWYQPDPNFPQPPTPGPITALIQTGARFQFNAGSTTLGTSVIDCRWEGADGADEGVITYGSGSAPASGFPEIDSQTFSMTLINVAPGYTNTVTLALSIGGGPTVTKTITFFSEGPPPAPVISLVASSIDLVAGSGAVAITFQESATLPVPVWQLATEFILVAENVDTGVRYSYDRGNGTALYSNLQVNGEPPASYRVYMEGRNSVGTSTRSNILSGSFNPNPPLPTNATNLAMMTFLVGSGANWKLNTNHNPLLGDWDPLTGTISGFASENPVNFLTAQQGQGVRFIVSIGGATFNVADAFATSTLVTNFAHDFAYAFLGVPTTSPNNWKRFFTDNGATFMTFDGFDFDFESLGPADQTLLPLLVVTLRNLAPTALITMSPQPPYTNGVAFPTAFNANGAYSAFPTATSAPDAYNPGTATNALLSQPNLGYFNYVFIQYYNNQDWEPTGPNFKASVAQWAKMVNSVLNNANTTIILGFASADAERIYNPVNNMLVSGALRDAQTLTASPSIEHFCSGAGFWNSPTAQSAFVQLYDNISGVELLPSNVIMLWLNQNSIDPGWQDLPIFDEIPSVLPQPTAIQIVTAGVRSGGVTGLVLNVGGSNGPTYSNIFVLNFANLLSPSGRPYTDCNTLKFALSGSATDIEPYKAGWTGGSGSGSWQFNQGVFKVQNSVIADAVFPINFTFLPMTPYVSGFDFLVGSQTPEAPYIWQINLSDFTSNTAYINLQLYPQGTSGPIAGYANGFSNVWLHIIPVS